MIQRLHITALSISGGPRPNITIFPRKKKRLLLCLQ
nr:MAG TPA: hypothetical protein [Caudoviricetes sp.]